MKKTNQTNQKHINIQTNQEYINIDTFTEGQFAALKFIKKNLKAAINRLENITAEEIMSLTLLDNAYTIKLATTLQTKKHFLKQIEEYEKQINK